MLASRTHLYTGRKIIEEWYARGGMKKVMIQFHAAIEELVEYANSASSELGLIMTVMVLRPFTLQEIEGMLSVSDLALDGDIHLVLTREKPIMGALSPNNFYDLNTGVTGLHVGRLTERGLRESALAFMSDDEEKISVANKLASRLKKITRAGATAVNPITGAEASVRSHRYTEGAKAMYDKGVKILPAVGNSFLKLPS